MRSVLQMLFQNQTASMAHKFALKDYGAENKKPQDLVVRINLYFDDGRIQAKYCGKYLDVIIGPLKEAEEEFKPYESKRRVPSSGIFEIRDFTTETWDMYIDDTFEIQIKTMF